MTDQPPQNDPASKQSETGAGRAQPSLGERLAGLGLSATMQRYAGIALVLLFALLIVMVMRNFSSDVQASQQEELRATAEALAQPMIDSVTGGAAGELMPAYSAVGAFYDQGIPRLASMDTIIPTRAQVGIATYEVKEGDNLFAIAETFGLRPETILWGNFEALDDNPTAMKSLIKVLDE